MFSHYGEKLVFLPLDFEFESILLSRNFSTLSKKCHHAIACHCHLCWIILTLIRVGTFKGKRGQFHTPRVTELPDGPENSHYRAN